MMSPPSRQPDTLPDTLPVLLGLLLWKLSIGLLNVALRLLRPYMPRVSVESHDLPF